MEKTIAITDLFTAEPNKKGKHDSKLHRSYFRIAGITVCLEHDDLSLSNSTFKEELNVFKVDSPGEDNITLRHHFKMPDLKGVDLGKEFYRRPPWAISLKRDIFCYKGILPEQDDSELHRLAFFNADHSRGVIYSPPGSKDHILNSGWQSLSLFPTDQIWLAPLLADRSAVLLHSAAAAINGQGFIFVGHSDAGKSTTMELLKKAQLKKQPKAEILCDDRNIIRRWPDGWYVHGTWSHGDVADVSSTYAPLKGILFLEQAPVNEIASLTDRKQIWRRLLATLIKPMVTAKWWEKEIDTLEQIVNQAPCYIMRFDKTGAIISELERLTK